MENRATMRGVTSSVELAKLRATLLRPVLRMGTILALPIAALSIYNVIETGVYWPVAGIAVGYIGMLVAGLVGSHRPWRVWALPAAMALFGLVELLLYGRAGNAPLYLLGGVAFTGLLIDERKGYGYCVGSAGLLVVFLVLRLIGQFEPFSGEADAFSWLLWLKDLIVFGIIGGGFLGLLATFLPRLANALSQIEVTSMMLREDRNALKDRIARLRHVNEELVHRAEYGERELSIAESLSTVLTLNPLMVRATELIADRFELDDVRLYTVDSTGAWAYLRAASSERGRQLVEAEHRVRRGDEGAVASVLDNPTSRLVRLDERAEIAEEGKTSDSEIRSIFAVPLLVGDKLTGILEMQSMAVDRFSDEARTVLENLGRRLALDIATVRRLGDEARALEIARPFYQAAQQLAEARTDRDVYAAILEALQAFHADRILLVRLDAMDDHLVLAADLQEDQIALKGRDLDILGMQSVIDVVILGLALETSLWVEDIAEAGATFSPELVEALFDLGEEAGVAAMAFVPLQVGDEMLGGLLALHDHPHSFAPVEQRLFELVGGLGGAALERSTLICEAETRLRQERALGQIGRRLRASHDPDTVVRIAREAVGRLLDIPTSDVDVVDDSDSAREEPVTGFERHAMQMDPQSSTLRIPVGDEMDPLAWLQLTVREERNLTDNEIALVEQVAVEFGYALESARLFTETQTTLQEAEILYRGSRSLVETGRTDELLRVFVDNLVAPELDRCVLLISERDGADFGSEIDAASFRVEALWDAGTDTIRYRPGDRWRVRDLPVLGAPVEEVVVVSDLTGDSKLDARSRRTLVESLGVRAFLASPVIGGERLLGWFVVLSLDTPYDFTEQEIRLYRGLSDQAATVLRNVELLEMATTRAEQEHLLADISARMRETLDMDLILQTTLREIGENLDVSQIEVQMQSEESL